MLIEIEKKDPRFDAVRFCAVALTKDRHDKRGHNNNIRSKDGFLYGTNGKRLHVSQSDALEDGYYLVAKNTKSLIWLVKNDEEIQYPDFSDFLAIEFSSNEWLELPPGHIDCVYGFVSAIIRKIPNEESINYNFVEDALQDDTFTPYVYKKDSQVVAGKKDSNPIILKAGYKTAYLMPLST